jgi:lysophospholipase L1-like esterase
MNGKMPQTLPIRSPDRAADAGGPPPAAAAQPRPRWKGLLFRLLAVALGLAPLAIAELSLRGLGLGKPTVIDDPFVGFSDIHPLFVLHPASGRYEIPKSRQSHFRPESFLAAKPKDEFRVFVLGGSTVQGRPYAIETSFTTWLELALSAADPSRRFEVVNCGGISYASYRLVPILQEVLRYEPDLIVFCEGHNEFLEDRTYGSIKAAPPALAWPQRQVARLRTYNMLRQGLLHLAGTTAAPAPDRPVLGAETDALLDWQGGIAQYHRDPQWQADVTTHFEFNLRRIVAIADSARVPLVIVSPVSNLQWPPFKPEHRAGLSAAQRGRFERLRHAGAELIGRDPAAALACFQQAVAIDPDHAGGQYDLGMCLYELHRLGEARDALIRAKDLDVCPLRMLEPMRQIIRRVADETATPLVDADALIAAHSRSGFPDNQWLIDHVHPTIEGHQLLADALVQKLADLHFVSPRADWQAARDAAYQRHLAGLSHAYFERGQTFLRSEQNWARGRATKVRQP